MNNDLIKHHPKLNQYFQNGYPIYFDLRKIKAYINLPEKPTRSDRSIRITLVLRNTIVGNATVNLLGISKGQYKLEMKANGNELIHYWTHASVPTKAFN